MTRLNTITADTLMRAQFPPAEFVIPSILPTGLTLLAGRPKIGKSWFVLHAATAVASGAVILGERPALGDVLYLALEDGPRRLQERLAKMLVGAEPPKRLHFATECPVLGCGGEKAITDWARAAENPRLVIVDVLQRVRQRGEKTARLYDDDYAALLPLKAIADAHGLAVIAVTHTRKASAEIDPFDAVSATTGLVGAADHTLILDRSARGMTLYGRGRDVAEIDLAVRFDPSTAQWTLLGDSDDVNRSETRKAVLAALVDASEPIGPSRVAAISGLPIESVKKQLQAMAKSGEACRHGRGLYSPTIPTFPSVPSFRDERDGGDGVSVGYRSAQNGGGHA
jgi:hypothetical protein